MIAFPMIRDPDRFARLGIFDKIRIEIVEGPAQQLQINFNCSVQLAEICLDGEAVALQCEGILLPEEVWNAPEPPQRWRMRSNRI